MSEPKRYRLKRPNHSSDIIELLNAYYRESTLTDASLLCAGETFKVHRLILSMFSPFFRRTFESFPNSCNSTVIVIANVPSCDMRTIIEFVYCGEISVHKQQMNSLFKSAAQLEINGLRPDNCAAIVNGLLQDIPMPLAVTSATDAPPSAAFSESSNMNTVGPSHFRNAKAPKIRKLNTENADHNESGDVTEDTKMQIETNGIKQLKSTIGVNATVDTETITHTIATKHDDHTDEMRTVNDEKSMETDEHFIIDKIPVHIIETVPLPMPLPVIEKTNTMSTKIMKSGNGSIDSHKTNVPNVGIRLETYAKQSSSSFTPSSAASHASPTTTSSTTSSVPLMKSLGKAKVKRTPQVKTSPLTKVLTSGKSSEWAPVSIIANKVSSDHSIDVIPEQKTINMIEEIWINDDESVNENDNNNVKDNTMNASQNLSNSSISKEFRCKICLKMYETSFHLNQHMSMTHKRSAKLKCKFCENCFDAYELLMSHMRNDHPFESMREINTHS